MNLSLVIKTSPALSLLFFSVPFNLFAQKLPVKQEGSLQAPANIKIDGKASEWDFKAYNTATDVYYTIAHDENNIYLVVKAKNEAPVRKIVSSGITFKVSSSASKKDTAAITYPLFNYKNKPAITFTTKSKNTDSIDFIVTANNKQLTSRGKFLRTNGINDVDSLLSVYNTAGISVACAFDKDLSYIYELALPRNLIAPFVNSGRFSYRLVVNGIKLEDIPGVVVQRDPDGNVFSIYTIIEDFRPGFSYWLDMSTDFSGEYVLTGK